MRHLRRAFAILVTSLLPLPVVAAPPYAPHTIPIVFLSDIHFNPFQDPATVAKLVSQPVSRWNALLAAEPAQPTRTPPQQACAAQPDTQYVLFHSGLRAMKLPAATARFVTVSGDLLGHNFLGCYEAFVMSQNLAPGFQFRNPTPLTEEQQRQYSAFVEKTIAFITTQFAATFPGKPIYYALGNNDSDCGDYQLDPNSEFLRRTAALITAHLPQSQRTAVRASFAIGGDYDVPLAGLPNTRLIVIDDLFLSTDYSACPLPSDSHPSASASKPDPAAEQIAWLKNQLDAAQSKR